MHINEDHEISEPVEAPNATNETVTEPFERPKPDAFILPVTMQGRDISARNATRHGCCADNTLILPNENIEDYDALEATWFDSYQPQDAAEKRLVQQLVHADWFLERANRALAHAEAHIYEGGYIVTNWSDNQHLKLTRFTRYQTARANAVIKCRKAIEDYRKARLAEKNNSEKLHITKERLKTVAKKNDPVSNWKEHLEAIRKTAVDLGFTPPDPKSN